MVQSQLSTILRHRLGYSPQVLRRAVLSLALAFAIVADRGCGSAAAAAVFEPPRVSGGEVTADQVELYLSDPQQNWDVVKDDPDFLLVGEKKDAAVRHVGRESQFGRPHAAAADRLTLEDLEFMQNLLLTLHQSENMRTNSRSKRGKILSLSLTNNIDVLREKLYMEIARRNRLRNQNQMMDALNSLTNNGRR